MLGHAHEADLLLLALVACLVHACSEDSEPASFELVVCGGHSHVVTVNGVAVAPSPSADCPEVTFRAVFTVPRAEDLPLATYDLRVEDTASGIVAQIGVRADR